MGVGGWGEKCAPHPHKLAGKDEGRAQASTLLSAGRSAPGCTWALPGGSDKKPGLHCQLQRAALQVISLTLSNLEIAPRSAPSKEDGEGQEDRNPHLLPCPLPYSRGKQPIRALLYPPHHDPPARPPGKSFHLPRVIEDAFR